MYKLIIVDDEKNAREGIRQLLKWKNFDIEVVDMCCSASEGIQSAMKYKPDIIITDIKMQNVDGLTMIEEILKHIKCEVIIISGYASFEYAQRAINISVAQYLLKPVSRTDLEVAVLKCIMNIQHNTRSNLVEKIGKNEYMLDMLINEDISTEGLIDFKDYYLYIMKSKADFVSDFDEKMKIYKKVNKGIGDVYTLFINRKELMLITADKIKSFDSLKAELSKAFCVGFAYGNHNMKFSEVYFNARTALNSTIREKNFIQEYCDTVTHYISEYYNDVYNNIIMMLESNDIDTAKIEIRRSYMHFRQEKIVFSDITVWTEKLLSGIQDIINKNNHLTQYVENLIQELNDKLNNKDNFNFSVRDLLVDLCDFCRVDDKIELNGESKIKDIVKYVDSHYCKNISLKFLSGHFYLEQKYLSKLFKNYIGQGFVEYVTNKRIEKAKKLLANTNYTISEIAEQVAYEDANYFSVVFKRNVGITPREYRMKYQK